jgi:hypothetical protein
MRVAEATPLLATVGNNVQYRLSSQQCAESTLDEQEVPAHTKLAASALRMPFPEHEERVLHAALT